MTRLETRLRTWRIVATVVAALVCAGLPVFLVGALSPWITADLGLDPAAIGMVVGTFFLASAAAAMPGGAIVDRIGATTGLRVGALLSAAAAIGIGGFADGLGWLLVLILLASCAVPLVDTGSARAIRAAVPTQRQGLAFGSKEAGVPGASLLAGIAVPAIGAQVGWRPAFLAAATLAVLVALVVVPRGIDVVPRPTGPSGAGEMAPVAAAGGTRTLRLLVLATVMSGAAATAAPAFLVPAVISLGTTVTAAGILLAVGSAAGITTRLVAGLVADRSRIGELRLTAGLMAVGALGLLALASGRTWATIPGAILTLGAGWGWTGLAFLGAVRLVPARPGAAAGQVLAALMLGGAAGAAAFGRLVAGPGYLRAWQAAALVMALGALLAGLAARPRRTPSSRLPSGG